MTVMRQPDPNLPYDIVPEIPRSDGKTFFGLHLYLPERCSENSQCARAPRIGVARGGQETRDPQLKYR